MKRGLRIAAGVGGVAILAGSLLLLALMLGCQSQVKVTPASSEATRTVDKGSTKIRAIVYPPGVKP